MPSRTPEVQRSSAVGRSRSARISPSSTRGEVLRDHQLGDLGRAVGRLVDHPVGARDADLAAAGLDLAAAGFGHAGPTCQSPELRPEPPRPTLRPAQSSELGSKLGRRSTSSLAGRTNSKPAVVTCCQPGRRRRPGAQRRLRARRVQRRQVEGVARRPPRGVPTKATGRPSDRAAAAAHPAQRALGDPRTRGRARRRSASARDGGHAVRAHAVRDQPPSSDAAVGRSASRLAGRASTGVAGSVGGVSSRSHRVGQRQLHDRAQRLAVLPVQRAGRVGDVVLVAQRPHPHRDLGVPVARQVREQVVLDLVAEVAAT